MVTSEILNSERDLAKRIFLHYTDKMLAYISVGSDKYMNWYKKSCSLYFLTKGLFSMRIDDDGILYMGKEEINANTFYNFTRKVREYITYDIREFQYLDLSVYGDIRDISIISTPPILITYSAEDKGWKQYLIDILVDGITEVPLPFDSGEADINSVRIIVNDGDPVYITNSSEEGVHLIGSTLYWHTFYDLKGGDVLSIQYLKVR